MRGPQMGMLITISIIYEILTIVMVNSIKNLASFRYSLAKYNESGFCKQLRFSTTGSKFGQSADGEYQH